MKIEIKGNRTTIHNTDINSIKTFFTKIGIMFSDDAFCEGRSVMTTTFKRRILAYEYDKLLDNGCTIMRQTPDRIDGQYQYQVITKDSIINTPVVDSCIKKRIKFPKILKGFTGNIATGANLRFRK